MLARQATRNRHERPFGLLVRHFFGRFFDTESLSPQGDPAAGVIQTLGILAVPGAFFVLLFRPLTLWGWDLVAVRYMFMAFSMIVMGFIMVFEWDALFPDRRDYQILTVLPLRLSHLFLAKALALAAFMALFLVDINFFSVIMWPGVDGGKNFFGILWAHVVAVLAAGLFAGLAIAAFQGVLVTILPGTAYRRVSVALQTLLMGALVMLLFLSPMMGFGLRQMVPSHSTLLNWFPGFWFIGFYERLRPATESAELAALGTTAVRAMWITSAVFLLTYIPLYRRHARKMLETPEPSRSGPGRLGWISGALDRTLLTHPIERGVFHFISETMARSVKHRLFLATYGGFGAAVAVMTLGSGSDGLLRLPLSLSFVLISGLRAAFNFPSELGANWAFQVTETAPARYYLAGTRKWIVTSAIVPLFALLAPMEFASFPLTAALFHIAYGIALTVLLMAILFFGFRKVPFTCAHFPGKVNLVGLGVVYVLGFTLYSRYMAAAEAWLYATPVAAAAFFAAAAALYVVIARLDERETAAAGSLDYVDEVDPVIRTLDLRPQ